jgi:hypothetical protein
MSIGFRGDDPALTYAHPRRAVTVVARLPRGEHQDVRLAFGHTVRGHAKTLLGDHHDAVHRSS